VKAPRAAAAAVTERILVTTIFRRLWVLAVTAMFATTAYAGVLPDDRVDVLYHLYKGDAVDIDGPSVLVRKKVANNVSVVGNYYVDMVSSASIDVVTTASPYTEERKQWSLGMDYLRGNTKMSLGYTSSEESDYDAETYSFSVSQDMFGDLTTLTLSYALGDDLVRKADDATFERDLDKQVYGLGLTQILTRNLITSANLEIMTDEGYLNNPYRSVRYLDATEGYKFEGELYPNTRTSTSLGLRARYFLPYRAAIEGEYRYFTDTWDMEAHTTSLTYIQPWRDFTFTAKYRFHDQTAASFYRDIFAGPQATNFRARDKELSPLESTTMSLKVAYTFLDEKGGRGFIKKGTVTASYADLNVDYSDFRDLRSQRPVGSEPLYFLDAQILQLYFSFWY
jgi:hypothetical protein